MPFLAYYLDSCALDTGGFRGSDTPDLELDQLSLRPGGRNVVITEVTAGGRGAALVAISGLAIRLKRWTTSPTGSGTQINGQPKDGGSQAHKAIIGADSSR